MEKDLIEYDVYKKENEILLTEREKMNEEISQLKEENLKLLSENNEINEGYISLRKEFENLKIELK